MRCNQLAQYRLLQPFKEWYALANWSVCLVGNTLGVNTVDGRRKKPWMIRFPCKYQQTCWFQPWCQSGAVPGQQYGHYFSAGTRIWFVFPVWSFFAGRWQYLAVCSPCFVNKLLTKSRKYVLWPKPYGQGKKRGNKKEKGQNVTYGYRGGQPPWV